MAAADPTLFETDPLQPDTICMHSWMIHTLQAPVLDLTNKVIKTKEDLEKAFHELNLLPKEDNKNHQMAEKEPETPTNPSKLLTDSDTSDDNEVSPRLRTSVEGRDYGTIPGSVITT